METTKHPSIDNDTTSKIPLEFDRTLWVGVVYGYLYPLLIVCIVATNTLVCAILCRKSLRSPTNVFLVAMAVSDTLTGLFAFPVYISFYTNGNYQDWIPFQWCRPYHLLIDHLPTVFHTASIWLTVCLAAQRYLIVCRPSSAKSLCSMRKSLITVLVVYIISFLFHSHNFYETEYFPMSIRSKFSNETVVGCDDRSRFHPFDKSIYSVHTVGRVVFVHIFPCILLILFNAVLVRAMRKAGRRRKQLLKQNMRMEGSRLEKNNRTTLMLVIVVAIFLLVEVPLAFILLIFIIPGDLLDSHYIPVVNMVINFIILFTYPFNFFIYCRMNRQFRKTLTQMFTCPKRAGRQAGEGCVRAVGKRVGESDGIELTTCNKSKYPEKNTCLLIIEENTAPAEN